MKEHCPSLGNIPSEKKTAPSLARAFPIEGRIREPHTCVLQLGTLQQRRLPLSHQVVGRLAVSIFSDASLSGASLTADQTSRTTLATPLIVGVFKGVQVWGLGLRLIKKIVVVVPVLIIPAMLSSR